MSVLEPSNVPPIPISEHSQVLIAMHKAMRADSRRLISAVDALPMYPFLLQRVPGFEGDALQLEDDHVELDAAMARINARFRLLAHQLSARLWQDTRGHLLEEAAAFDRVLVDHLDREEAVVVPPFESLLSEADQHALQKEEAKLSTYRHMRMAVPWVLANATRKRRPACEQPLPVCSVSSRTESGSRGSPASWPRCTSRPRPSGWWAGGHRASVARGPPGGRSAEPPGSATATAGRRG